MNLDAGKSRLQWQCRRGMLELDALLREFLDEQYDSLAADLQGAFRRLLEEDDPQLFSWLFESPREAPPEYRDLVRLIRGR